MRAALGYALLSLPFVLITAGMILSGGWFLTIMVWATVIAIVAVIAVGVRLVNHD